MRAWKLVPPLAYCFCSPQRPHTPRWDGRGFEPSEIRGSGWTARSEVTLFDGPIVASGAVEIKPKSSQKGFVFLVRGDVRGNDIWDVELIGRLAKP